VCVRARACVWLML